MFWQNYLIVLLLNCEQNLIESPFRMKPGRTWLLQRTSHSLGFCKKKFEFPYEFFHWPILGVKGLKEQHYIMSHSSSVTAFSWFRWYQLDKKIRLMLMQKQFNCLQIALTPLAWSVLTTCMYNCSIDSVLPRE